MSRVSQAQALENRASAVAEAARLFRERGVQGVSVADVMKAIGLTPGGFYKQFGSKEALVAEATIRAFEERGAYLAGLSEAHPDATTARKALLDEYLSPDHRDDPGTGCAAAGLAGDIAKTDDDDMGPRGTYADGVREFADWLSDTDREDGLAATATLVGAILLARATAGTDLSEDILAAARRSLEAQLS
ncbi:TetR/AcrR family transcriptional regulator [Planotetraspora thailandica]|uniref:TetR/AcrR family transcriptional regulator n=1 Tax=Planotetraspora thailandica TaxID=487172 RepID=UPI00194DD203|nr:TetR/AcrR family transcriptional regulator [Planotetraspora thailandica]